ncbi:ABC transporter ATP-binding protein [uncultured Hoeflea sp.]|uniref:ABC transporter ATP-binding protein n=1 Tax=uncultured Hoeflea sp. TaxID=538666 RepID=UPI0026352FE0|nr:ABC transporter ATP-binding protein [uncultured Hoeflea sp.]
MSDSILAVESLTMGFDSKDGFVEIVRDVSFSVRPGEILGIVGESGSGKSLSAYSIMGLIDPPGRISAGKIWVGETNLLDLDEESMRELRGTRIAMIFQDPMMTLNPVLRIDTQMIEAVQSHFNITRRDAIARSAAALERVGISDPYSRLRSYPHELSGGMRQRIAIAIAVLNSADVIIADEPTTALDVTIQSQILYEVQRLCAERGTSAVWISHDLGVVSSLADRVCVMYAGQIVEQGPTEDVIASPRHPYTAGLLASTPGRGTPKKPLSQIRGSMPTPGSIPSGCAFRERCDFAQERCLDAPELRGATGEDRFVRCHFPFGENGASK